MLLRASWGGEVLKQNGKQNAKAKPEGRNNVIGLHQAREAKGTVGGDVSKKLKTRYTWRTPENGKTPTENTRPPFIQIPTSALRHTVTWIPWYMLRKCSQFDLAFLLCVWVDSSH